MQMETKSKGEAIKAKGDELLGKFYNAIDSNMVGLGRDLATLACAIIAVEEILSLPGVKTGSGSFIPVTAEDRDFYHKVLNYLKSKL